MEPIKKIDDEIEKNPSKKEILEKRKKELYSANENICERIGLPIHMVMDLAFDRFGTHPLENFNGNVRDTAHNNDTMSTTPHIVARAHVQKCLKIESN